ncbi:ABC transporter permease [Spiroplasma endosymbiont of Crioceris asparagi]|uniref:ABC transporter permease n=1 Tax=Spiroplasma endosymbiont of Crioceris asparagi TaxID=3066286 RepID=UPI0030D4EBE7
MKNIKLLTKEAIHDMKKKSILFFSFLIFLMFGIAFSIGIFQFYSTFNNDGRRASDSRFERTYNYAINSTRLSSIEKPDFSGTDFEMYAKQNEKVGNEANINDIVTKKQGFVSYKGSEKFYNNIIVDYVYNKVLSPKNLLNSKYKKNIMPEKIEGLYDANKCQIQEYNFNIDSRYEFNPLKVTSKVKNFDKLVRDVNSKSIIVGSTFLSYHKLKLGDKISFSLENKNFSDYTIVGSAYTANEAFKTNVNKIYLNNKEFIQTLSQIHHKSKWIGICLYNTKDIKKNISKNALIKVINNDKKYFSNLIKNTFASAKSDNSSFSKSLVGEFRYEDTPKFDFNNQLFIYRVVSLMIASVVLIVVIISYFFVEKHTIDKNLKKLSFLKSMGFSNFSLVYYILFSSIIFVFLASIVGYLFSFITYTILAKTIGYTDSFLLPAFPSGGDFYIAYGIMLLCISLSAFIITYFSITGDKLSIHNKKISNFELAILKIKDNRLIQKSKFAPIIAFQVSNLVKGLFVLIITCLALAGLGLSLQLSGGINAASKSYYKPVFHNNKSVGFLQYDDYQWTEQYYKNNEVLTEDNYKDLLKPYTLEQAKEFVDSDSPWEKLKDYPPIDHYIPHEISGEFMEYLFEHKDDKKVKENTTLVNLINNYKIYKDTFKGDAIDPVITFKNAILPKGYDLKNSTTIWTSDKARVYGEKNSHLDDGVPDGYHGVSINYNFQYSEHYDIGSKFTMTFKKHENENPQTLKFVVKNINYQLLSDNEAVIDQKVFSSNEILNLKPNAIFDSGKTPWTIKYLTVPMMKQHADGKSPDDFFVKKDNKLENNLDFKFVSLPVITDMIKKLIGIYYSLILIGTYGMIIFTILMLMVIDLIIIIENKRTLLVLKTLGYSRKKTVLMILSIYPIAIIISYFVSLYASSYTINALSDTILEKMKLKISSVFTLETSLIPLVFAVSFIVILIYSLIATYRKIKVEDISSFAE